MKMWTYPDKFIIEIKKPIFVSFAISDIKSYERFVKKVVVGDGEKQ